jgi:hypothetical protein
MSPGAVNHADGSESLPKSADLRRLLDYWRERCGTREFPRRADVDPLDLRFMLDRIALTEVHPAVGDDGSRRYRLRVVGSFWYRVIGFEMTGRWTYELSANLRQLTEDFYAALIEGRRPRFARRDVILDEQLLNYEIMLLPLSEDGSTISMIMTGIGTE